MPSTHKTPNIGLNKFIATDKPKMDDVNFDNQKLDTALSNHFNDANKHYSQAAATTFHNSMLTYGFYTGNGAPTQHIELGFHARVGIVFAPGYSPFRSVPDAPSIAQSTGSFFSRDSQTRGVRIVPTGLTVFNNDDDLETSEVTLLNHTDIIYHYILWK